MAVTMNKKQTQNNIQTETRWGKKKEERKRRDESKESPNIIVTAVHKRALYQGILSHNRKEVNTN